MAQDGDEEMPDAGAGADATTSGVEFVREKQRLRLLPGSTDTAASFAFDHEDHTLGNALRYMIMKNPNVEFCGYSIPHPSEPVMNLRIQTWDDVSVFEVLRKGLNDLEDLCDVVEDKFTIARDEFDTAHPEQAAGR
ncbi:RNA polymerase subunit AC19 [Friedmanniomyces endolithicus]|uniref:DNA-directed RNA polymerases I and III subunit RPAC2 n=1 Tax=Friedmanniomyces endolithicus TaxID=329885 RepID=A0AAN6K8Y5_9PEZI|nr:RNA polymerase subunit AC19 [Friedmanniomyces endolithicus]KAK0790371.1 RNA polymerase subunit AC19 [Friedmanniomyces endolithicus]KAK0790657.1 RNA polymerase subunit AC19 [Friedmanniomyces endolithicus]KAK0797236.1 RNA polymerase subunit AC19 [Friedmanniomyces endolithicus]KAK0836913.1 RNA polymerase subunit AC19 [Friedmanniomyces endolithicus]